MERRSYINPVLFEIVVVVLFFALSATVVLGVFMDANRMSKEANALGRAIYAAQDLAERLSGADQPEEYLTSVGFVLDGDATWKKTDQSLELWAEIAQERGAAGLLHTGQVGAQVGGQEIELPLAWYVPGEGEPNA